MSQYRSETQGIEWTPPEIISDQEIDTENPERFIETIDMIVEDMLEQRFGRVPVSEDEYEGARQEVRTQVLTTSNIVDFPWLGKAVRYPSEENHRSIRTWRNRNLITLEEQQEKLTPARIAFNGLSVGSNIALQQARSGIGSHYILADADRISPSNLNRMHATMADVGLRKTVFVGRKIAEIDPYIEQVHLNNGYEGEATDEVFRDWQPDILFDEVDNLSVKAMLRRIGSELKTPVVMVGDIGEKSIMDVERYDTESPEPFNGKISLEVNERLLKGEVQDPQEIMQLLIELNGAENISQRLFESAVNPELGGLPQLGATAATGASFADRAVRAILLEQPLPSGTYISDPDKVLGL